MNINHKSLKKFEKIILFFLKIFNFFIKKNSIRVLVYHHIKKDNFHKFENQIYMLRKNWNFITPNEFESHISGKKKLFGKNLLITFDDGFKSNFVVAKNILNKHNIKAIFFVPSDFIQIESKNLAKNFAKKNILDEIDNDDIENIDNLSLKNLEELIKEGHLIGCHTKTHLHLGSTSNEELLKEEIIESLKKLEELLKIKITHFAFTYGDFKSMNLKSLAMALTKYNFIYSCLRGSNFYNKEKTIIKRDTVYLNESNDLLKIFLSGFADLGYLLQINKINRMIKNAIDKS
tara:strand:+ start:137 stop:1006 length:870 start_codon:yes stop_codon:yes gene_type:complete